MDRQAEALLTTFTLHFSHQTYLEPLPRETGRQRPSYNAHTALQSSDISRVTTQRDRWTEALLPTLTLHFSHQTYLEPLHRETDGQTGRGPPNNAHTALQSSDIYPEPLHRETDGQTDTQRVKQGQT